MCVRGWGSWKKVLDNSSQCFPDFDKLENIILGKVPPSIKLFKYKEIWRYERGIGKEGGETRGR